MTVTVDRFGMHALFYYYYPLLLCSYRNGWQIRKCVLCMTVKIKPIHTISYELKEYMPGILPSLSSLLLLIFLSYFICYPCGLWQFWCSHRQFVIFFIRHGTNTLDFSRVFDKHYEFFQSVWETLWNFSYSVWFEENSPFYFRPLLL